MSALKVRLAIKVLAGSSRTGIVGWLGDTMRVRVSAAPERGKANTAVEALLSEALGLPRRAVRIVSGRTSPRKVVEVTGMAEAEIRQKLADASALAR